mgnify:CR=1 FL=1|tara:strand:+ start:576 stop:1112 length:537 start_codon:yes stop_codon:yes gene_type:complete
MQRKNNTGLGVGFFNMRKPNDVQALNAIIDTQIAENEAANQSLKPTHAKMVEWLKSYVNEDRFIASFTSQDDGERTLELVAEATFWSVNLGLDVLMAKMSHAELRIFQPLREKMLEKTERTQLISAVCDKLVKPAMSHEASFALQQASWCVYIKNNSMDKLQEEDKQYDSLNQFGMHF